MTTPSRNAPCPCAAGKSTSDAASHEVRRQRTQARREKGSTEGEGVASKLLTLERCRTANGRQFFDEKLALMLVPYSTCGLRNQTLQWLRGFDEWNVKC